MKTGEKKFDEREELVLELDMARIIFAEEEEEEEEARIVVSMKDITERKRVEEALRESKEFAESLIASMQDGLSVLDSEGVQIDVNAAFCRMTGFSREELIGVGLPHPYWPQEAHEEIERGFQKTLRGEFSDVELTFMRKNGERFPVIVSPSWVQDKQGNVVSYFATVKDITDRKQVEDALRVSEERFRSLSEAAFEAIAVHEEGVLLSANDQFFKMFGYEPGEVLRKQVMPMTVAPEAREFMTKQIATGRLGPYESIGLRKDGSSFPMEIRTRQMEYKGRNVRIGALLDITERKQAEEGLRQAEENFRHSLDDSPLGVRIVTIEGETIYANRAILDIHGYDSVDELRETPVKKRYTLESYAEFQIRREKRKRGDYTPSEYTISIIRKDGHEVRHLKVFRNDVLWDGERQFQVIYQDITLQKRAEERLKESEVLYRSLFEESVAGISQTSPDGRLIHANMAYAWMYGYASPDEMMAEVTNVGQLYANPEERQEVLRILNEKGVMEPREFLVVRRDGTRFFLLTGARVVRDTSGNLLYYQATQVDITERKRAEEELHIALEKYRVLFEMFPLGISLTDKAGHIIETNRESERLLGVSRDEHTRREYVGPEWHIVRTDGTSMPTDEYASVRAMKGNRLVENVEMGIVKDNQEITWVNVTAAPIPLENFGVAITYGDITERKQAEEALRQSEEKYRDIFDKTVEGIFRTTPTGRFFVLNPAFAKICGYASPEEMKEKVTDIANQLYANPEDRLRFQKLIAAEGEVKGFEVQFKHPTKGLVWISINSKALRDEQGNIQYYDGTIEDITVRKQAEEELKASEQQFRALAERLQQIREEERVLISRDIHDEMGGGLTGLKMDLSWLLQKVDKTEAGEERVALMSRIHASNELIDHMIKVVRRIATDLRPSVLDDLGLIAAIEWELGEFTSRTEIPHEFVTAFEYVYLEENTAVAVFRIFQETLTNVARHSEATKIAVLLREEDGSLFLEIKDNGRGITEGEIQNTKSLGLLGMKERALVFGGELSLSGEPDEGTSVILKIPQKRGEPS